MNKGGGWNALFWCNHDQPRVVSRFGDDQQYHKESAKMLATTIHMMQGTPYIYQGEEFGMTNPKFDKIEDYRDVESLNIFEIKKNEGLSEQEIIEILKQKSRDNSRTPVQWNSSNHAGFTTGTPWIHTAANYKEINAENAMKDSDSVFYHYRELIRLRKEYDVITNGDYELISEEHDSIFAFVRNTENEMLLVINNFYGKDTTYILPVRLDIDGLTSSVLLSNYEDSAPLSKAIPLRPYESIVYHLKK
jgi:trehalose-6-phosphate hydrolase